MSATPSDNAPTPAGPLDDRIVAAVEEGRDELVALARELVALDTTAREVGDPPHDEERLQRLLAARLEKLGAEVDLWEPEPTGTGNRHVPDGLTFEGRPQLAARLAGRGGGRSLLLNGHIDAVPAGAPELWASDPFAGEVRAGRYWTLQSNVLWRVADILPIVNQTLYGGVGLEGGHVWERVDPVPDGDLYGFSLYLGGRTPLGTVTLGVGRATGSWAGWLTLGTPVGQGSILDHPLFR